MGFKAVVAILAFIYWPLALLFLFAHSGSFLFKHNDKAYKLFATTGWSIFIMVLFLLAGHFEDLSPDSLSCSKTLEQEQKSSPMILYPMAGIYHAGCYLAKEPNIAKMKKDFKELVLDNDIKNVALCERYFNDSCSLTPLETDENNILVPLEKARITQDLYRSYFKLESKFYQRKNIFNFPLFTVFQIGESLFTSSSEKDEIKKSYNETLKEYEQNSCVEIMVYNLRKYKNNKTLTYSKLCGKNKTPLCEELKTVVGKRSKHSFISRLSYKDIFANICEKEHSWTK